MRLLLDYSWHGNVRELHNVVEYAFAVGRGTVLKQTELPPEFREIRIPILPTKIRPIEDEPTAIQRALKENKNQYFYTQ